MKSFLTDGLSISESKFSLLALLCLICTITAIVLAIVKGDIPTNLLWLCSAFITGITGINIANRPKGSGDNSPTI